MQDGVLSHMNVMHVQYVSHQTAKNSLAVQKAAKVGSMLWACVGSARGHTCADGFICWPLRSRWLLRWLLRCQWCCHRCRGLAGRAGTRCRLPPPPPAAAS